MGFFQHRLHSVPQPRMIARQLVLAAHHRAPQPLFGIGHKAQRQLLGHQPLQQPFGVSKVILAPPSPAIGQRLREMERSRHRAGVFPLLADRLPVPFQYSPNGLPVLRRRFHHYFLDRLLDQPFRQQSQLLGVAAKQAPLELVLAFDFDVGHDHCQHPLMNIDPRYPIRHNLPPGGSRERAASYLNQVRGLSPLPQRERQRPFIRSTPTLRTRQGHGLDLSFVTSISLLPASAILTATLTHFHEVSRAAGPTWQGRNADYSSRWQQTIVSDQG